ncbi:hypothetical protein ACROYT_G042741 [Oculina patagonica]
MIIPSLYLREGTIVDPINGKNVQDVSACLDIISLCPDIAIVCLDKLKETKEFGRKLVDITTCCVECETDSIDEVLDLLDNGASRVILGKEHMQGFGQCIPKERITCKLTASPESSPEELAKEINNLKERTCSFLLQFTFSPIVEVSLVEFTEDLKSSVCGDVRLLFIFPYQLISCSTISQLHSLGVDVQTSATRLLDELSLGEIIASCLKSDRSDGLFPTLVVDEHNVALGLCYSSAESIQEAVKTKKGVYFSRTRGLWRKGETSGNQQDLLRIFLDCDSDTLKFVVHQQGLGFCHLNTWTCFGANGGLPLLMNTLKSRKQSAPPGSYTDRLYSDSKLLHAKIREEAEELCEAESKDEIASEAADVLYFTFVKCAKAGVSLPDIEKVLDQRSLKVRRRPGNAKPKHLPYSNDDSITLATELPQEINPPAVSTCNSILKSFDFQLLGEKELQDLCKRPAVVDTAKLEAIVRPIMANVRSNGDKALLELTEKFDKAKLSCPVIDVSAVDEPVLEKDVKDAIDLAYGNIYKFHKAQLNLEPLVVETCKGVVCSRHVRPIEKVGLYVPGGSAVLPSTALMLGIPAQVAGCKEVILATPPKQDGSVSPEILYIAKKVEVSKILLAGGAQAVTAMAYGTESVPKVDKLCGPGNAFVTMAKMLVQNDSTASVSIDMPAGPSEVMVIADESADPSFVAADLLSQAEHGTDSQVVLVAVNLNDKQLDIIQSQLDVQAKKLPREKIIREALSKSFVIQVSSMSQALYFSNKYAPEHLIVNTQNAEDCLKDVQNAGSVFLGPYSSESCGDYASGTNHTLPTYGYARMYSGVSTASFQKHITAQCVTKEGLANIGPAVATLASVEKLDAHRNAILIRQGQTN